MKLVTTYKSVNYNGSTTLPITTNFADVIVRTYNKSGSVSGTYFGCNTLGSYINKTPSESGLKLESTSTGTKFTVYYSYWE